MESRLTDLYRHRFNRELEQRDPAWRVLYPSFFQRFVKPSDAVLDIGAGHCEFINNIRAGQKFALDLNAELDAFADQDVQTFRQSSEDLERFGSGSMDVVFMSDFLEHLHTKAAVQKILVEIHHILRPGGRVLVLGPNIRHTADVYWEIFDHSVPLSDRSLVEGLRLAGFEIDLVYPRFLPFTTKSRLPQWKILIELYLKIPIAWRFLGKQFFVVGSKKK